jgi:hypothetical protein
MMVWYENRRLFHQFGSPTPEKWLYGFGNVFAVKIAEFAPPPVVLAFNPISRFKQP